MSDQDTQPQAIVILIDNSYRSIDGDFPPNRLDAQKNTTEHLILLFTQKSSDTQISIGTLGENNIGIAASLTKDREKLNKAFDKITPSGHIKLSQGIKFAFLALHHRDTETIKHQRIIVFVGSEHDLTEQTATNLANTANKDKVAIDIIAFGDDVKNINILSKFVDSINEKSYFLKADDGADLAETVLLSPIGHGTTVKQTEMNDDPDLYYAREMSYQEILQKTLEQSLLENQRDSVDQEFQAAIQESMRLHQEQKRKEEEKRRKKEQKKEEKRRIAEEKRKSSQQNNDEEEEEEDYYSSDESNDPDLLEAIKLSKQDIPKQDDGSDDNNN